MLDIKVLGGGCANCHKLEALARQAVQQLKLDAQVELVTDMQEIMRRGIMHTPALVINDKIVSTGRVPALSQVTTMIANAAGRN
ncbi:MAG: thioredoxin family protein [Rudaea sp.]